MKNNDPFVDWQLLLTACFIAIGALGLIVAFVIYTLQP